MSEQKRIGRPKGHPKTGGRAKGTPNKATLAAREAIAQFVDGNVDRMQGWLDKIAEGQQDDLGNFVVKPDPAKAFELLQSVIEYHVPKLARTELTGKDGKDLALVQAAAHDESL